jgi:hypothetical protein
MTSAGAPGQRRYPSHEAALELLGVERRKNIAEMIVRGRSIAKRSEPAQGRSSSRQTGRYRQTSGSGQHR